MKIKFNQIRDLTIIKNYKKKGDNSETIHNKYADDNMRRKCKHILINNVMEKHFIKES